MHWCMEKCACTFISFRVSGTHLIVQTQPQLSGFPYWLNRCTDIIGRDILCCFRERNFKLLSVNVCNEQHLSQKTFKDVSNRRMEGEGGGGVFKWGLDHSWSNRINNRQAKPSLIHLIHTLSSPHPRFSYIRGITGLKAPPLCGNMYQLQAVSSHT